MKSTDSVGGSHRNFGLDVLRATAIVMVMLTHAITMKKLPFFGEFSAGVDLFFVLSGFLIGRIYFRTSKLHTFTFRSFWVARWWRTLPPYLAGLLVYALFRGPDPALRWFHFLFLQNFQQGAGYGLTWSLCVEEHFYLALPLLAFAVDKLWGREAFRYLLPVAFVLPLCLRLFYVLRGGLPAGWYFMTPFHVEGMVAGVWLAYYFVEYPATFEKFKFHSRWLLPVIPIVFWITPIAKVRGPLDVTAFTLLAIGFSAWLCFAYDLEWSPTNPVGRGVRWSVQALALAAYSLYLTHTTFYPRLRALAAAHLHMSRGAERTVFVIVAALAIGGAFFLLVERPAILSRNRYLRHKKEQTLPQAA